eukprot:1626613-Rhodomonas_salina.1
MVSSFLSRKSGDGQSSPVKSTSKANRRHSYVSVDVPDYDSRSSQTTPSTSPGNSSFFSRVRKSVASSPPSSSSSPLRSAMGPGSLTQGG